MGRLKKFSGGILKELYAMQEYSTGKAILSRLRNSIGRNYVGMVDIMPYALCLWQIAEKISWEQ